MIRSDPASPALGRLAYLWEIVTLMFYIYLNLHMYTSPPSLCFHYTVHCTVYSIQYHHTVSKVLYVQFIIQWLKELHNKLCPITTITLKKDNFIAHCVQAT